MKNKNFLYEKALDFLMADNNGLSMKQIWDASYADTLDILKREHGLRGLSSMEAKMLKKMDKIMQETFKDEKKILN